jgi:Putative Flp pilus-assembly TadE/G-like/von Willebrand factor type A domain
MKTFRRFKNDTRGTTAVIFGLAALPLVGFAGAAVDYSRASAARADLQRAADATALALVRDAGRLTDAQLQARGRTLFGSLFRTGSDITANPLTVTRDAKTIRVAASATVQTTLLNVMGFRQIEIGTDAKAAWGGKKIELALVLDNTGSMDRTVKGVRKIDALKTAANNLLDTLYDATADAELIKVSVVPFNTQVRVDTMKTGLHPLWLSYTGGVKAGNWKGYIEDRDQPYDVNNAAPTLSKPATLFPAAQRAYAPDLAAVQPLTGIRAGRSDLRAAINSMQPTGNTNITIGVAWGLAALTNTEPMSGAAPKGSEDVVKAMIVLTDGENTQNRINGASNYDPDKIDLRTRAACTTTKTAGITVVTIRVVEGNADLLKDCASRPTDRSDPFYRNGEALYHDVQNPADLTPIFQNLANQVLATRLTQ